MEIGQRISRALSVALGLVVLHVGLARATAPTNGRVPNGVVIVDNTAYLDANTILMFVDNTGAFAHKSANAGPGLEFPRLSGRTLIYAAGLWIGAKVNGEVFVTKASYSEEYTPGPMLGGSFQLDNPAFRVYKIRRGDSRATNPDYDQWPFDQGAPAQKDHLGNDSLDPGGLKIPQLLGEQALWTVFNDADPRRHVQNGSGGLPLGVEVQLYAYADITSCEIGQTIFLQYRIINKGENTLDSAYLSLWADPDVGDPSNDLVGCDTSLSLGFCYDPGPDEIYGVKPPSVGITELQGPIVPSASGAAWSSHKRIWLPRHRNLPMTAFSGYDIWADPYPDSESYNLMRGLDREGAQNENPEDGQYTLFMYSGDPTAGSGWLDQGYGDRRFVLTSGPLRMNPGDTQEVVAAVMVGAGAAEIVRADTIYSTRTSGSSSGKAFGLIMSPEKLVQHEYEVGFKIRDDSIGYLWSLRDKTLGTDLLSDMPNQSGNDEYPVVNGVMVKVIGPSPGVGECVAPNGEPRFIPVNSSGDLGFEGFHGTIGWESPAHLFGTLPRGVKVNRLRHVLLKLAATNPQGHPSNPDDPNASFAYRYGSLFCNPPARYGFTPFIVNPQCGFAYQDFKKSVPLSAWDIESVPPRRLAIGYLENNASYATVDGVWFPPAWPASNIDPLGPREWLWIFDADYSESPNPAFQADAATTPLPVMYFLTFSRTNTFGFQAGEEFRISRTNFNTEADAFGISSPSPTTSHLPPFLICEPGAPNSSVNELKRIAAYVRADFMQGSCACAGYGDPKPDGVFDVLDVIAIVDRVLGGGSCNQESVCPVEQCDFNADGATDMPDVVAAINYAFNNGPGPRNPCL